jgi:hypothetical protein
LIELDHVECGGRLRNTAKVLKVLGRFGFGSLQVTAEDLQTPDKVVQLGFPPVRIDLVTSLTGISNEEVFSSVVPGDFYGIKIPIISKPALIQNKKATGRIKDLLDVQSLE